MRGIAFAILKPDTFLSASNAKNIFSQITTNTILAVGMTFVILIGGIDLSVGAVMVLSAIAAASVVKSEGLALWLAVTLSVLAGVGVDTVCGFLNGWVSEKTLSFTICGLCAGVAGVIFMARVGSVMPIAGEGAELDAIAAVIIGGTSLFGGKGSFIDTFIGACIIGILNNGLVLLGLRDFYRQVVTGVVIVLAVIIDTYRARVGKSRAENFV